jgi:hypothetical protein
MNYTTAVLVVKSHNTTNNKGYIDISLKLLVTVNMDNNSTEVKYKVEVKSNEDANNEEHLYSSYALALNKYNELKTI